MAFNCPLCRFPLSLPSPFLGAFMVFWLIVSVWRWVFFLHLLSFDQRVYLRMRNFRVWESNPSEGFSCHSFFCLLCPPSPIQGASIFFFFWKVKILRKWMLYVACFTWESEYSTSYPTTFFLRFAAAVVCSYFLFGKFYTEEILIYSHFQDKRSVLW